MDKKELEKRLQEIKCFWGAWDYCKTLEADYLQLIYELWEENKKLEEENDEK